MRSRRAGRSRGASVSATRSRWWCSIATLGTSRAGGSRLTTRCRSCSWVHRAAAAFKLALGSAERGGVASERSRYGLFVSALGAVVLAVSVFLPWYALTLTPAGADLAQNLTQNFAEQFGNASLQQVAGSLHGSLTALSGHQIAAMSAHQVLHDLNVA